MKDLTNSTGLNISFVGYKDENKEVINNMLLKVDDEKTSIDFNVIFKKPT